MSERETHIQTDKNCTSSPHPTPRHPFFKESGKYASFTDCIDAIDRVRSLVELCDYLELDESRGGLSSSAAFGYYWITVLNRETLNYVSKRLRELDKNRKAKHRQDSTYMSALLKSLHTLGSENRERLLNNTAAQLNLTRPVLDQYFEDC